MPEAIVYVDNNNNCNPETNGGLDSARLGQSGTLQSSLRGSARL